MIKYKEPVMGFEPATYALRKRCSTPELHRLMDCFKRIINTLVVDLTLAIIPFVYSPCQAFLHPLSGSLAVAASLFAGSRRSTKSYILAGNRLACQPGQVKKRLMRSLTKK